MISLLLLSMTIPIGKVRKTGGYSRMIPVAPKSLSRSLATLLNLLLEVSSGQVKHDRHRKILHDLTYLWGLPCWLRW